MRISDWSSDVCSSDLCGINNDRPVVAELLLETRMAVIPICARLNDREFINEFGSRLDAGKTDAGYAVHLKGQDQTVPVDRAVFVKIVDDGEACGLSLLQPDKRRRQIGRASCRKECVSTCRFGRSPDT